MKQSEEIDQLATALAAFQAEMPKVTKDATATVQTKTGRDYSYKYADIADVVEAAAPITSKHGLAVYQSPGILDGQDVLTTLLMHKSGQWLEDTVRLHATNTDPQGLGSAITYMRRYAYCAALGVAPDKDDDGAAASQRGAPPATQKATTRRPPPRPQPEAVPKEHAKNELLAACGGDMIQAKALWVNAGGEFNGETVSRAALDRLLAKAKAATELEGAT